MIQEGKSCLIWMALESDIEEKIYVTYEYAVRLKKFEGCWSGVESFFRSVERWKLKMIGCRFSSAKAVKERHKPCVFLVQSTALQGFNLKLAFLEAVVIG